MVWKRILFIINPEAGHGISDMEIGMVSRTLSKSGAAIDIRFTLENNDAARWIDQEGLNHDLIVVAGGDGTLKEVSQALLRAGFNTPVAFLPVGSTNDVAQSLNISKDLLHESRRLLNNSVRPVDVGLIGEEYFIYVCSFGAFTETSWQTPRESKQMWGHLAYLMEGAKRLPNLRGYEGEIVADGEVFSGKWAFGAVLNTHSLGGIIKIPTDQVKLNDGLMELLLIREPQDRLRFAQVATGLLNQKFSHPDVIFRHCRNVTFRFTEEEVSFTLDGEFGGFYKELNVDVVREALSLVY